jgi:hypothetical protein
MAPRKTRAAAKAQTGTSHPDEPGENSMDAEDQTPEPERDLEAADEEEEEEEEEKATEEDMPKAKGKKNKKGGKKKGKKAKTDTPEVAPEQDVSSETVEEAVAEPPAVADDEFNPAAMPVLRSPKKELEQEPISECRQIASS